MNLKSPQFKGIKIWQGMAGKKRILLTGYGAFHTHNENPSQALCEQMASQKIEGWEIETKILPVVFAQIPDVLADLDLQSYDVVIFTGLAASREEVTPEKVALNWLYSPDRADNSGEKVLEGKPLIPELPLAQMATFPVEELTDFLNEQGIESKLSFSAGTYVCNSTFFHGLCYSLGKNKCCFIHLPQDVNVDQLAEALSCFLVRL